jgi:hypothetical protein
MPILSNHLNGDLSGSREYNDQNGGLVNSLRQQNRISIVKST